jgi:hypothetical protein
LLENKGSCSEASDVEVTGEEKEEERNPRDHETKGNSSQSYSTNLSYPRM